VLCYLPVKRRRLDHASHSVAIEWSAATGGAAASYRCVQAGRNC
jgi:hypothetical protein